MTTGRQLIEQGFRQGFEEGFQQGLEKVRQQAIELGRRQGIKQGSQALLLRLLRHRFGDAVGAHVEQRIAAASVEEIQAWAARLISPATLAAVFAV